MKPLEQFIGSKLGNIQTLGWFGFSADPPTLAHRAVVDAALGSGLVQKVVAFPAGKLRYKDFTASDWQRAEMTEFWGRSAEWDDEVILSRFDLQREVAITWVELWKKIKTLSHSIKHQFIVGSDQYQQIGSAWHRGQELLDRANFIIVPREGYSVSIVPRHHHLLTIPPIPGSSTDIRQGDLEQVDAMVKAYIIDNQLYKN